MGKKKHASNRVCAAGSSGSKEIENLKTRNEQLENQVAESRKQIEQLRLELQKTQNNKLIKEVKELRQQIEQLNLELASQTAEQDILADMERDVIRLVISSAIAEANSRGNTEIAAVMKKAESAAAKLNAVEMRLFSLRKKKDETLEKIENIVESLEQERKSANPPEHEHGKRMWRKWIYHVAAAAASFFVATAAVILFCSKNSILRT